MTRTAPRRPGAGWLLASVLVQAAIGASMVPLRYLQSVVGLPGLAVIALSDLTAFSIMSWQVLPKIDRRFWRSKTLWVMVIIVIVRTILLTFATRLTRVYLIQLINLLAPFLVVLLNRIFVKTPLPKRTIPAISMSMVGGAMMVFGGVVNQPLAFLLTAEDALGMLLAFLATFGIAGYMMIVKRGEEIGLPFEIVYISQIGTLALVMGGLSLAAGEDWSGFLEMDWRALIAFFAIAIGVEIGCKMGNITTLRKLGAPLVSSMLAVRLVAALIFGWIFLGERLTSPLQWVGAVLVVGTVTWFLLNQRGNQPAMSDEQSCPTGKVEQDWNG